MSERTPLQAAAKRVYDELKISHGLALDLRQHGTDIRRVLIEAAESKISGAMGSLELLMHEDDCE